MEPLVTNPQECANLKSYESENAFLNFHTFELKNLEQRLIAQYFTDSHSEILDLGCGYGRTTIPLADMGHHVIGVDIVPRMIETAKAEHPEIDFRLMSVTELSFPDESFDGALFSFNGIDYIYPQERRFQALREIWRVLKPGGICILTSHNRATLLTRPRFSTPLMLWHTLRSGLLFSPYIVSPYEGGDQVVYCKMPFLQAREYRSSGFHVVQVIGKKYTSQPMLNVFESWPYFVLQKPNHP